MLGRGSAEARLLGVSLGARELIRILTYRLTRVGVCFICISRMFHVKKGIESHSNVSNRLSPAHASLHFSPFLRKGQA